MGEKVTYAQFVCDHRPKKPEPYRVRCVVGGDKLDCPIDSGSPTTNMIECKVLLNSVISDAHKNARFMSLDIKDFFLATPMKTNKYMRISMEVLPQDIIERYDLLRKAVNGYVYVKIKKGMYGLKEAAVLAYNQLVKFLEEHGYYPEIGTAGLWSHKT